MKTHDHDEARRQPLLSRLNHLEGEIRWVEDIAELVTLGADRSGCAEYTCNPELQADALGKLRRLQDERARLLAALGWLPMDGCCPCRTCGCAIEPDLLLSNPTADVCARCVVSMPE